MRLSMVMCRSGGPNLQTLVEISIPHNQRYVRQHMSTKRKLQARTNHNRVEKLELTKIKPETPQNNMIISLKLDLPYTEMQASPSSAPPCRLPE